MTDKDRKQFMEVLLALGGYNDIVEEDKKDKSCQSNCQSNQQSLDNKAS